MDKELINKSIDYFLEHLDEDIRVGDVAERLHFSESYFCREFKETTGESVYAFIKRLKMDQSAVDIKLLKEKPLTDIGLDYGYSSSNYSSAFRKHHSVSPAQFRKSTNDVTTMQNPFYPEGAAVFDTFAGYAQNICVRELDDLFVIYERVIGSYVDLKQKWPVFVEKYGKYITGETLYIERFYDDPTIACLDSCIYDVCITSNKENAPENCTIIKGGKYAVYHYMGLISDIFCSVQGVFSVWLPQSGHIMDERYGLNIYRSMDASAESVDMELYIPIK